MESGIKRTISEAEEVTTIQGPYHDLFKDLQVFLDAKNDRRERLVKVSRDLTIASKRLGFNLHRTVKEDASDVLPAARIELAKIVASLQLIAKELTDPSLVWYFQRAFTAGMQEFIESVTFMYFLEHRTLLTPEKLDEITGNLFPISSEDYLLGIADLSGELMRYATNCVARGQASHAQSVLAFMRELYSGFALLHPRSLKDYDQKLKVMIQSVRKVEQLFYSVSVRGAERPASMLAQEQPATSDA